MEAPCEIVAAAPTGRVSRPKAAQPARGPAVAGPVQEAVTYAADRGVVVVAATGNSRSPICGSPAFEDGAICVTASDRRGLPAHYSNGPVKPTYGDSRPMAVAAPGGQDVSLTLGPPPPPIPTLACTEEIVSTYPVGSSSDRCGEGLDYALSAGTSFAAPHVSGVVALLVAASCSRTDVHEILRRTSRQPTGARGHWTPTYGWGVIDADAATRSAAKLCASEG